MGFRPWALDFTPDDAGYPAFPHEVELVNPYLANTSYSWTTGDWDPALRFWTLPYDKQLTEWLKAADPSLPSIAAAREFGSQSALWQPPGEITDGTGWLEVADVAWNVADRVAAWNAIQVELEELQTLMQDDRDRYLAEAEAQADGLANYVIALIGASGDRHPWTMELISSGLAIGNIAYMYFKAHFKRVRPSFLCPGLIPPFGPPRHPSFPSGHSFLGHLVPLLLLEIPALRQRFGVFSNADNSPWVKGTPGRAPTATDLRGTADIRSPLLWLGQRLAKGRERIGVHYASDSWASRHLAAGIWDALWLDRQSAAKPIVCPTLMMVLNRAKAEWA